MKVRIKELAQEAKFIRFEENKIKSKQKIRFNRYYSVDGKWLGTYEEFDKNSSDFWKLRSHRTHEVKNAARAAQLAYGFLRGVPYSRIENKRNSEKEFEFEYKIKPEIKRLAHKFGNLTSKESYSEEIENWLTK